MIIKHKVKTYSISRLARTYRKESSTGLIDNYYTPESIEELVSLCENFYLSNEEFKIVGHTSNVYFLPETNLTNVVSIRLLKGWRIEDDYLYCECGAPVYQIVRYMVNEGINGYALMIDLPGTVSAAIYGNAGVGVDCISNVLESVDILLRNGEIKTYKAIDLCFSVRSSALKRKELEGVIISCRLKMVKGDASIIKQNSQGAHEWRIANQPKSLMNLGTTSLLEESSPTLLGLLVRSISSFLCILVCPKDEHLFKEKVILSLIGKKQLVPYLHWLNRYVWVDCRAHDYFKDYLEMINLLYKKPRLEIEVW